MGVHSFLSSAFLNAVGIQPVPAKPKQVKVANGETLISDKCVLGLQWWCQGHTFTSDMRVLDLPAYDAILGYDWLTEHSPILHNWEAKTMQFTHGGESVVLKGVPAQPLSLEELPIERVLKWAAGNDIWAYAVLTVAQDIPSEDIYLLKCKEYWMYTRMSLQSLPACLLKECMTILSQLSLMLFLSILGPIDILLCIKMK